MIVFLICKCPHYNSFSYSKKQIEQDLADPGWMGLVPSDKEGFQYIRNSVCGVCGTPVYFSTNYTKKHIYNWAMSQIAKGLQKKV